MATDILKEQYKNLQQENDRYKKLNSQLKDRLVALDKEVTVSESKIRDKRTIPGGFLKQQGKHIRILENKLNQETTKIAEVLCSNMDYSEDISHLLQQKGLCCDIDEKFNRQLAAQQKVMERLEERISLALKQRSEAKNRMLEVREGIKAETDEFIKKRMQLKTAIAHGAKLQTFMETKLKEIIPLEGDKDSKKRKKQQQYESGVKKLEMYLQGHRKLVEVTGETDLGKIVPMFTEDEQKNFALVGYINELQNRRNRLKNCTDKMKSDILFLEEENKGHDEQINSQLKDLETDLERYSCLSDSLEEQCTAVQRTLDQLTTAICGLSHEIMQEAVVNSDNIYNSISMLEERINNLLIQANNVEEEQTNSAPQNILLANSDLLPGCEAALETECGRPRSRSLKSA
ncbi:outer dynein arm-docking complex subunit 1-like [Plectropomus leopardus]|uniref:outer dynein arm-docking complex subunit 1-like n=1 Tax=Plectropomus leopardus TaxID=160734 RepID=UPI001C4BBED0|nr:outer dynein arm-docking complex subunit 1-like [Plectropomus leopardus]